MDAEKVAVDTSSSSSHNDGRGKARFVLNRPAFEEIRCGNCNALLYREVRKSDTTDRVIEIRCRKCGAMKVS